MSLDLLVVRPNLLESQAISKQQVIHSNSRSASRNPNTCQNLRFAQACAGAGLLALGWTCFATPMAPKVAHGRAVLVAEGGRENGPAFSGGRLLQGLWSAGTRCIFFDLTYMHARWPKLGRTAGGGSWGGRSEEFVAVLRNIFF